MTLTAHSVCIRQRRRPLSLSTAIGSAMPLPLPRANHGGNPLAVADGSRGSPLPAPTATAASHSRCMRKREWRPDSRCRRFRRRQFTPVTDGSCEGSPLLVANSNGPCSPPLPTADVGCNPRSSSAAWQRVTADGNMTGAEARELAVRLCCRRLYSRSHPLPKAKMTIQSGSGGSGAIDCLYATTAGAVAHSVPRAIAATTPTADWSRASAPPVQASIGMAVESRC